MELPDASCSNGFMTCFQRAIKLFINTAWLKTIITYLKYLQVQVGTEGVVLLNAKREKTSGKIPVAPL